MKTRNLLLALFCLLVFAAFGVWYFQNWVVQKPFGIILFIGDGLVGSNLTAARVYKEDHHLTLETLPHLALLSNYANDFAVPDSAAAASALATGVKVNNGSVAIDPHGKNLASILDAARREGRATGIISTGSLTDPGVAAFYAHANSSKDVESIAGQFADEAKLDVAMGGGAANFSPLAEGGLRKDGRDLLLEMKKSGRTMVRSKAELENAPVFGSSNLVGLFSAGNMEFSTELASGSQQPSLSDMVRRAIELLQYNQHGYLLVVDAELITRAAEQNDGEHVITETIDLDNAVSTALTYAGKKALILAAGKHNTGGMTLNGYPFRQDHGIGVLGTTPIGYPSITWATGPNGAPPPAAGLKGVSAVLDPHSRDGAPDSAADPSPPLAGAAASRPDAAAPATSPAGSARTEPAAFYDATAINTADDVIAVGIGPGSQGLHGFMDNTVLFDILKTNL